MRMRGLNGRQQTKEYAGKRADPEREGENSPVKIKADPERDFVRKRGQHQIHAPDGEEQSKRAANHTEDKTFGQELAHDLAPARTQRETNPDFLGSRGAARQEKV